jgi:hypothetical protein
MLILDTLMLLSQQFYADNVRLSQHHNILTGSQIANFFIEDQELPLGPLMTLVLVTGISKTEGISVPTKYSMPYSAYHSGWNRRPIALPTSKIK